MYDGRGSEGEEWQSIRGINIRRWTRESEKQQPKLDIPSEKKKTHTNEFWGFDHGQLVKLVSIPKVNQFHASPSRGKEKGN